MKATAEGVCLKKKIPEYSQTFPDLKGFTYNENLSIEVKDEINEAGN